MVFCGSSGGLSGMEGDEEELRRSVGHAQSTKGSCKPEVTSEWETWAKVGSADECDSQ